LKELNPAHPARLNADAPPGRILIVDDHPPNLVALEAILSPLGQELVHATSGEDALRKLLEGDFAVILMDVQMPGLDGLETAGLIKKRVRSQHTPIIFLTAIQKDPSYIFRGYSKGAVDYLLKPFDPEILRAKVLVFVDLWRKGEQIKRQTAMLRAQELVELEQRNDRRYRQLTDSMPTCVWAAWSNGEIYYANRVWIDYAGPDCGVSFFDAVPEDELKEVRQAWRETVRKGLPLEREQLLRRNDGVYRWHLCRAVPERDERGVIVGFIASATDIERQKRAEANNASLLEREMAARTQAEVANRSKDEFLATVSHELRTPLNAILGWTRMLQTGAVEPAALKRALDTIERNARAQTQLVEDILDVSRIIAGKLRVEVKRIDLHSVVRAAMDAVRPAAENKSVALEANFSDDSVDFYGDPDRLQQVTWNLLVNAIKFTPKNGRVDVKIDRRDSHVELSVADTGSGISPEFLPHVFDRFRQADSSITRTQGGLGLGLAIVRHLVEVHGGTVSVESEGVAGKGSRFVVRMPVRAVGLAGDASPEDAQQADLPLTLAGLEVLVVDDEADARELVTAVLTSYGARVRSVASAERALEALREKPSDVLISDIGMPHEDGYSLIRRLRALPPEQGGAIPAGALTAYASADDHRRALEAGFHAHITKPVEPSHLAMLVATLAGRGEAPKVLRERYGNGAINPSLPRAPVTLQTA